MDYFDHHYISNSDLKALRVKTDPKFKEPINLDEIYKAGSLNHHALLEPHKADRSHAKYELACTMAKTVLKDKLCSKVILMQDFRREWEWYRIRHILGRKYGVRCKTDGDTRSLSCIFEYKGLAISTDSAFEESIYHFDYDQAVAFYMDTVRVKNYLIAGVSKPHPDRLFKRLVDRDHAYYKSGVKKEEDAFKRWHTYMGDMKLYDTVTA